MYCHPSTQRDCHGLGETVCYSPCYSYEKNNPNDVLLQVPRVMFSGGSFATSIHLMASGAAASAISSATAPFSALGPVFCSLGAVFSACLLPLCTAREEAREWRQAKPNDCHRAIICGAAVGTEFAATGGIAICAKGVAPAIAFKTTAAATAAGLGACSCAIVSCACCFSAGIAKERKKAEDEHQELLGRLEEIRVRQEKQEHIRQTLRIISSLVPPPVAITTPQYQSSDG